MAKLPDHVGIDFGIHTVKAVELKNILNIPVLVNDGVYIFVIIKVNVPKFFNEMFCREGKIFDWVLIFIVIDRVLKMDFNILIKVVLFMKEYLLVIVQIL